MRTLIVYESLFGTNRAIAEAIAAGLGDAATVTLVDAETAPATIDEQVDLLRSAVPTTSSACPGPQPAPRPQGKRAPAHRPSGVCANGWTGSG